MHPSAPDGDDEQDDNLLFADLHFLADTIMDRLGLTETDSLPQVSSDSLLPLVSLFKGGGVSHFSHNWEKLTSDAHLISIVKYGVVLDFVTPPPKCSPIGWDTRRRSLVCLTLRLKISFRKGL